MKRIRLLAVTLPLMLIMSNTASAMVNVPYASYTYSIDGEPQLSPHAYIPGSSFSAVEGMDKPFNSPSDIVTDAKDQIYIADTGNNRVVILNSDCTLKGIIDTFDRDEEQDSLNGPQGIFVTDDGVIYISDTGNQRILYFSSEFKYSGMVGRPQSELFDEDYEFKPKTLVVDKAGRLFISAENMNMGIMVLDKNGNFKSFFGSQKVKYNPIELFWRTFMTEEQISRTESFVPTEYNSISIDNEGFIFVTSSAIDPALQYAATVSKSKSDQYAPVKRFGAAGVDVLNRNGAYPPSGDVSATLADNGPSAIVDCIPGKYGTYTLLDSNRNKVFTYDYDGNLLYAFGGSGSQTGMFEGLCAAVCLSDNRMICLDRINNNVTVFAQTEYGALLFDVLRLHDERKYSEEADVWQEILLKNNNLDYAYIGLGKSMIKSGQYKEAMDLFKTASNKTYYSIAYKEYRKEVMSRLLLPIVIAAVALVAGIIAFFSFSARFNRRTGQGKRKLIDKLMYGFYVIFHPFDGFWDLSHEGRGSMSGGLLIFLAVCAAMMAKSVYSGFLFSSSSNILAEPLILLLVVGLFVLSNWCVTSLTNGKGTAKQMLVTSCYALTPILLLALPQIALSHLLLLEEAAYITVLSGVSYVWTGCLLFAGVITVHQYSLPKAILTTLFTILGMIIIVVLSLMFFNLLEPLITFFMNYHKEAVYRF